MYFSIMAPDSINKDHMYFEKYIWKQSWLNQIVGYKAKHIG